MMCLTAVARLPCPHFLPFASCFGLCLSLWWESGARLCLWSRASPVFCGVLEQLRRDPSLGTPGAELQLQQWAVTVCCEMHILALGNQLFGQHGEGGERPVKNGCLFFPGWGEKPNKTHPTVACQQTSRGCPYPAPGVYSVLLITAYLAAESESLNLFSLGFPQQLFGMAPALCLHAWQPLSKARDWAALCLRSALDLRAPIVVEEGLGKTPFLLSAL